MEDLIYQIEERLRSGDKAGASRLLQEFAAVHGAIRARETVSRLKRQWATDIEGTEPSNSREMSWFVWLLGLYACWMWGRSVFARISGWFCREDEWEKTIDDLCMQWEQKRAAVETRLPGEEAEESRHASVPLDVPRGVDGRGAPTTGQSDAAQRAATEAGQGEGAEPVIVSGKAGAPSGLGIEVDPETVAQEGRSVDGRSGLDAEGSAAVGEEAASAEVTAGLEAGDHAEATGIIEAAAGLAPEASEEASKAGARDFDEGSAGTSDAGHTEAGAELGAEGVSDPDSGVIADDAEAGAHGGAVEETSAGLEAASDAEATVDASASSEEGLGSLTDQDGAGLVTSGLPNVPRGDGGRGVTATGKSDEAQRAATEATEAFAAETVGSPAKENTGPEAGVEADGGLDATARGAGDAQGASGLDAGDHAEAEGILNAAIGLVPEDGDGKGEDQTRDAAVGSAGASGEGDAGAELVSAGSPDAVASNAIGTQVGAESGAEDGTDPDTEEATASDVDQTIGPEGTSLAAGASDESADIEGKSEAVEAGAIVEEDDNLSADDITAPVVTPGFSDQGVSEGLEEVRAEAEAGHAAEGAEGPSDETPPRPSDRDRAGRAEGNPPEAAVQQERERQSSGASADEPTKAAEGLASVEDVGAKDAGPPPGFLDEVEDGQYGKQPDDEAKLGATEGAEADEWDFAPVAAGVDEQEESVLLGEEIASYRLPRVSLLGQTSFLMFISKLRFLPTQWTMPTSPEAVKQFTEAFTDAERMVMPNLPLNLFREMTLNAYHVNTAKVIGKGYEQYIKGITDAICDAIGKWSLLTVFAGVQINGPVGMVTPGCVLGPPLLPFILASAPKDTPMQLKYSMAIGNAISTAWQAWQSGLTGTLSYPAFAAFPAPVAPPMPSIPVPLAAFNSPGESGLSPSTLKSAMVANFADPLAPHAPQLFESIAQAFNTVFQLFKLSTIVLTVLGMGPVPAFAPPVVPVAPVVGGSSIPIPGAIMTPPLSAIPGPTGEYQIALTPFGK